MKYTLYIDRTGNSPRYHLHIGAWLTASPSRLILRHGVFSAAEFSNLLMVEQIPVYFGFQHSVFYVNERISFNREKVADLPRESLEWSVIVK